MYFVYLLQSENDGNYYIGQTNDIKKRLEQHNMGSVKATKHRIPFKLIGYEIYKKRNEARWREYQLKKHGDKKNKLAEFFSSLIDQKSFVALWIFSFHKK